MVEYSSCWVARRISYRRYSYYSLRCTSSRRLENSYLFNRYSCHRLLVMLLNARFPVNERVSSGTPYKEMLAEFGH